MESRPRTSQVADPRTSLAMWLRAGRAQRQLTLDDVARVTKIQTRILEKIEAGQLEGLPADVFVRGFVKSFARCVGLDESEAAQRYGQCANAPITPTSSVARAFVETLVAAPKSEPQGVPAVPSMLVAPEIFSDASRSMGTMSDSIDVGPEVVAVAAPLIAALAIEVVEIPVIEVVEIVEIEAEPPAGKKKRTRKKPTGAVAPRSRKKKSTIESTLEMAPVEVVEAEIALATAVVESNSSGACALAAVETAAAEIFGPALAAIDDHSLINAAIVAAQHETDAPIDTGELEFAEGSEPVVADPWKPTMPLVAASVPWNRPAYPITRSPKANAFALPTLVIDDSDPDLAELEREGRDSAAKPGPHRVSFLPPILLDRDDKSSRQGGLTLAVILLLIAATLTLSYLMRRPSVSGDGMTQDTTIVDTTTVVA
jgi:cytoskeletal protein RodZ